MPTETLHRLLVTFQANLKRRKGIHSYLSDPYLQSLHNICVQLDPKQIATQIASNTRFVVIDTETTGFHAYSGDEIVSISLLAMDGLTLTGKEYHRFVNPQRKIPAESTAIHGINDQDVAHCPTIRDIIGEIIEFIDHAVIVGHHVNFDIRFLNKTLQKQLFCTLVNPWIDTMLLYTACSGRVGHYTLDEVAAVCKIINPARHTAAGDAITTAMIFQQLAKRFIKTEETCIEKLLAAQYEVGYF